MVLVGNVLARNALAKDEAVFELCRAFMDEISKFQSLLVAEACSIVYDSCKDVLSTVNLDTKVQDSDAIKTIFMKLKQRTDATIQM